MKYIAIIGYGIVGGGITAVLEENACRIAKTVGDEVAVKYILDLRDFPDSPYGDRVVHSIDPILADITVLFDGSPLTTPGVYTYDETTGEFATLPGAVPLPAATYTQNPVTGVYSVTPGVAVITITGRV